MSYTKGKWVAIKVVSTHSNDWGWDIVDEKGDSIFMDSKANAKRIVHCVNNYDGLVEACEISKEELERQLYKTNISEEKDILSIKIGILKQAIAKAEEKGK